MQEEVFEKENVEQQQEEMSDVEFAQKLTKILGTNRVVFDDKNNAQFEYTFEISSKYSKDEINRWLKFPERYQHKLIEASRYFYNVSNHYKRLINYISELPVYSLVLMPYKFDTRNVDKERFKSDYITTANNLKKMNINHEFNKALQIMAKEDYIFGIVYESKDSFFIRKLNPKYCAVTTVTDGCKGFQFDFSYFARYKKKLGYYNHEFFINGYKNYLSNPRAYRWQEVPAEIGVCFKFDQSTEYCNPPFAGVFPELYELDDYKKIKKTKEFTNNYKLLSLKIPIDDKGKYKVDKQKILKNIESYAKALPDKIGLATGVLDVSEHTFDRAGQSATDPVSEATEQYWNASGVSSLLFSSDKSGSSVINASTLVDSAMIFSVYRQFERWINYRLKISNTRYKFQVQLLDTTIFNRKEMLDMYSSVLDRGFPTTSHVLSILGLQFNDVENMNYLENEIFKFKENFTPYQSSYTMSSNQDNNNDSGRDKKDDSQIEEKTEESRQRAEEGLTENG